MRIETARKLNSIPQLITFSLVTLLAAAFLFLSLTVMGSDEIPEGYVPVEATITEINEIPMYSDSDGTIDYSYEVFVDYSFEGNTYTHKEIGSYDSSMKEGDEITIYINSANPEEMWFDSNFKLIFTVLSVIFLGVGIFGIYRNVKNLQLVKRSEE